MALGQIERSAGLEEEGHDLGPAADVGQPVDRPPGDEHEVERPRLADGRRGVVEIGLDEARPVGEAQLGRERPRRFDCRGREVEPDHLGPALRQGQAYRGRNGIAGAAPAGPRPAAAPPPRSDGGGPGRPAARRDRSWARARWIGTRSSQLARLTARQSSPSSATDPALLLASGRIGLGPLRVNGWPAPPPARRCARAAGPPPPSTSASVKRGVMCCGQFQSNASTAISRPRSTLAR